MGSDPEKEHNPTPRAAHQSEPLSTSTQMNNTTSKAQLHIYKGSASRRTSCNSFDLWPNQRRLSPVSMPVPLLWVRKSTKNRSYPPEHGVARPLKFSLTTQRHTFPAYFYVVSGRDKDFRTPITQALDLFALFQLWVLWIGHTNLCRLIGSYDSSPEASKRDLPQDMVVECG